MWGWFILTTLVMNSFFSWTTRLNKVPYHAIIPEQIALDFFWTEPFPGQDIPSLGLTSIRIA